jgi:hypothetical protein
MADGTLHVFERGSVLSAVVINASRIEYAE